MLKHSQSIPLGVYEIMFERSDRWDNGMQMAPTHIYVGIISDKLAENLLCLNSPLNFSQIYPSGNIRKQSFSALYFGNNRNFKKYETLFLSC